MSLILSLTPDEVIEVIQALFTIFLGAPVKAHSVTVTAANSVQYQTLEQTLEQIF
jgi:hypothetical protein